MDEESEARLKELVNIYESTELHRLRGGAFCYSPRGENYASFMQKYEKNKTRKPWVL